jgi:hypothetical protein
MAKLIHPSGEEEPVTPANGKKFTLSELQTFVGGYIELTSWADTRESRIIVNEEGRLKNLPPNPKATALIHKAMAQKLKCKPEELSSKLGQELSYLPVLVGTVVVLEKGDKV